MRLLQVLLTRRTTLRLIGGSVGGVTLAFAGGLSGATEVLARSPQTTGTAAAAPEPQPVFPVSGAGLFDVDPDQHNVSQDPTISIRGDVASLPEDMEV